MLKKIKLNKILTVLFVFLFVSVISCAKKEQTKEMQEDIDNYNQVFEQNSEQYSSDSINQETTYEGHKLDDLFEVYHYIYSKGNVIKAETNVLFKNGQNDELQIIIDMPNGEMYEYSLSEKVSLGVVEGLNSYLYTSDENDKINVFFKNGREMMGITSGKESFVFMNTPDYVE
jgi:cell division protein YceG involved in septum cleavage